MNDRLQFEEVHSLLVTSEIETVINCETFSSLKKLLRTTAYVKVRPNCERQNQEDARNDQYRDEQQ